MKTLWIFFGVIAKLDYILGSLLCILGSFLKAKVQNGGYFKYFWGLFGIPDIFGGIKGRCWARAYV